MHAVVHCTKNLVLQWNSSNLDTIGPEESVLISEVSLFQGLKNTQTWYLKRKKLSRLVRCPYFRGVLIEGFHYFYAGHNEESPDYRYNHPAVYGCHKYGTRYRCMYNVCTYVKVCLEEEKLKLGCISRGDILPVTETLAKVNELRSVGC